MHEWVNNFFVWLKHVSHFFTARRYLHDYSLCNHAYQCRKCDILCNQRAPNTKPQCCQHFCGKVLYTRQNCVVAFKRERKKPYYQKDLANKHILMQYFNDSKPTHFLTDCANIFEWQFSFFFSLSLLFGNVKTRFHMNHCNSLRMIYLVNIGIMRILSPFSVFIIYKRENETS